MNQREELIAPKRFKDVLFALYAASKHNESLGRLRLQKLIYLADVLSAVWRAIGKPKAFLPYKNGPYDPSIQNTVDALAFRGLVKIEKLTFRRARNTECTYSITEAGRDLIESVANNESFKDDLQLYLEVALEVQRRGWGKIKTLVYADPTYDAARATNAGTRIQTDTPDRNLSLRIARDFEHAFEQHGDSTRVSRRNIIQLFFAVLDDRLANAQD